MNPVPQPGTKKGAMPFEKYSAFTPIDLPNRQWPSNTLSKAPRWCSVDLRDGNQALIDPMTVDEKMQLFKLLLDIGFTEIEVGFPAASQLDFDFIRRIIDADLIPENVVVQVLCQARQELIARTVEALEGAPRAIFHLYNSTSELQRRVVFNMERQGIIDLAVSGTQLVRDMTKELTTTNVHFEYSPESFTGTELDFAVDICEAVAEAWGATPTDKIIVNLPSTVEMATPNVYADQVEYFCTHFKHRDSSVVSLHTHNDRGTGIAATELALMAGAERVEGTLFGNGERTGNCDLVTTAMNLFSQGVDPHLDLRDMPKIRATVERINKLAVHERHPYAGDLVFTAFSGSHQDAIKKGIAAVDTSKWEVPYLPIDPSDVGSSYRESVRVNSQSGKGGIGFILQQYYGINPPRAMLIEFSHYIQDLTESWKREIQKEEILEAFFHVFTNEGDPYKLLSYELINEHDDQQRCRAQIQVAESELSVEATGSGPMAAFVNALVQTLNEPLNIVDYHESAFSEDSGPIGNDASAVSIVAIDFENSVCYGVGKSRNTVTASLLSIVSALNRRWLMNN